MTGWGSGARVGAGRHADPAKTPHTPLISTRPAADANSKFREFGVSTVNCEFACRPLVHPLRAAAAPDGAVQAAGGAR